MQQILIRHGQSVSNFEGRVQGRDDVPLSPLGVRQAEAVAAWAGGLEGVAEIWSSPLQRARETAAPIARALALDLHICDELAELHAGVFQGHLWDDLERTFPEAVARWRSGDPDYAIPGGESRAALAARGRRALETLAGRRVGTMIVVAHGGVLTAALGLLLGPRHPLLAAAAMRPFTRLPALDNASVSRVRWPGPELLAFNETGHLADLAGEAPGDRIV